MGPGLLRWRLHLLQGQRGLQGSAADVRHEPHAGPVLQQGMSKRWVDGTVRKQEAAGKSAGAGVCMAQATRAIRPHREQTDASSRWRAGSRQRL